MLKKLENFTYLKMVFSKNLFSYVDLYFAFAFVDNNEEEILFLAYLFAISRLGHINFTIKNKKVEPSAILLFGAGLFGLIGTAKRNRQFSSKM